MSENLIKRACRELGITQLELADVLKVNDGTVRQWSSKGTPPNVTVTIELLLENRELKKKLAEVARFGSLIDELKSQF